MKITVLIDNNTITDKYFYGEPALSLYIETAHKKILFDCGYSDIFIKNAMKSGINLNNIDCIVMSHGHDDHSGGLKYFADILKEKNEKTALVVAGVEFFNKRKDETGNFGCPYSQSEIERFLDVKISQTPLWIDDIVFLGKIPRKNNFEGLTACGVSDNKPDYVPEDSALVVKLSDGLVIVTGCSHSGIVNICEYAKAVCNTDRIISIIGGLHLKDASDDIIEKTKEYLKNLKLESLYACHCTGLKAQCSLSTAINLQETGSGLVLEF